MNNIIIEHNIDGLQSKAMATYQKYILCTKGSCEFSYNGRDCIMQPATCTVLLSYKFLQSVKPSADFQCTTIYIDEGFSRQHQPNNPYMIQGILALQVNPVMVLDEKKMELCTNLFYNFQLRLEQTSHKFYDDILGASVRMLLLDLLDIHSMTNKADYMSQSSALIMTKFLEMLRRKEYRDNREVAYYAEQLDVVPKYLSEVCNKISGFSASYWINRFASQDINELLAEKKMTAAEVSRLFNFTSVSYFNRYVKRYLGSYPAELRGK